MLGCKVGKLLGCKEKRLNIITFQTVLFDKHYALLYNDFIMTFKLSVVFSEQAQKHEKQPCSIQVYCWRTRVHGLKLPHLRSDRGLLYRFSVPNKARPPARDGLKDMRTDKT